MADTRRLITFLVVILAALVAAVAAIFWLLPSAEEPTALLVPTNSPDAVPLFSDTPADTPAPAAGSSQIFNVDVLRSSVYQTLNLHLINDGSLPVQPPAATGKANPFL